MTDLALRTAELRWLESGSPQDEARFLQASVREGHLSPERLDLAAALGHTGSRIATGRFACDLQALQRLASSIIQREGAVPLARVNVTLGRFALSRCDMVSVDERPDLGHLKRLTWWAEALVLDELSSQLGDREHAETMLKAAVLAETNVLQGRQGEHGSPLLRVGLWCLNWGGMFEPAARAKALLHDFPQALSALTQMAEHRDGALDQASADVVPWLLQRSDPLMTPERSAMRASALLDTGPPITINDPFYDDPFYGDR